MAGLFPCDVCMLTCQRLCASSAILSLDDVCRTCNVPAECKCSAGMAWLEGDVCLL